MTAAISDDVMARAARLSTATLHEAAGRIGALPSSLKSVDPKQTLCGMAFPVKSPAGDNLWLHRAVYEASPGDVLVIDVSDGVEFGYWGEVLALAAQQRKIVGLVITGGVRDSQRMVEIGFPVFSVSVCIQGTGKDPFGAGALGEAVTIGSVTIEKGDLIVGDADGLVAIPAAQVEAAVTNSERRDLEERDIFSRLRTGQTTLSIYNLPGGEDWKA